MDATTGPPVTLVGMGKNYDMSEMPASEVYRLGVWVARHIRKARSRSGLTQRNVCRLLTPPKRPTLHPQSIYYWEAFARKKETGSVPRSWDILPLAIKFVETQVGHGPDDCDPYTCPDTKGGDDPPDPWRRRRRRRK